MNIERKGPIRNFRRRITPLVFAATGEMEKEAEKFYKMLAAPLAEKRMTAHSDCMSYFEQKLSFCLLPTILAALHTNEFV